MHLIVLHYMTSDKSNNNPSVNITTLPPPPDVEPTYYTSTFKHEQWRDAIYEDFTTLVNNGT